MSNKDYIIIDGLPDELKVDPTVKEWLDFSNRHQQQASFRVIIANEELREWINTEYASDSAKMSRLMYPEIFINFPDIKRTICLRRFSQELAELRPDEATIDGFYQANMSIGALVSECRFQNGIRGDVVKEQNSTNAILELVGYINNTPEPCDLA